METESLPAPASSRGNYRVGARLQRALLLLASGEAKTQDAACATAGLTPRALQKALKRPNVQSWMREQIMTSLGLSAMRASRRMDELLRSPNEMVSFRSAAYSLAVGANIAPPERSNVAVNVALDVRAGFVIDISEPDEQHGNGTLVDVSAVEDPQLVKLDRG